MDEITRAGTDEATTNQSYLYDLQLERAPGAFTPAESMRSSLLINELPGCLRVDVFVKSALVGLYGDEQAHWVCRARSSCAILGTWADGSFKVRLRIALVDDSHGASSRVFVGRLPASVVEVLSAPLAGRVLAANVDQLPNALASPAPGARPHPVLLAAVLVVLAVLLVGLWLVVQSASTRAEPTIRAVVTPNAATRVPAAVEEQAGNTIVDPGCLDIGGHACLNVDSDLKEAVTLLETTSKGPALLRIAADAGVRIRIGAVPSGALADFRPSTRTVTLGPKVEHGTSRAQATVLAHELQHVSDWSKVGPLFNNSFNCYQTEASAFQTEAAIWTELRGKASPSDALEGDLDELTHGVQDGGSTFWIHLAGEYTNECINS